VEAIEKNYYKTARIRFYAELNDFLRTGQKQKNFDFSFKGQVTVRDAIESLGVPHSAVDLMLVNGLPAPFSQRIHSGDMISVYPEFETFDISGISQIRKKPLRTSRFIVDAHLGKLARELRMLGFDTLFAREISDNEIISLACNERRTIITRDRDLLKSEKVDHGYYVRSTHSGDQLKEVINKFDLYSQFSPFTRCLICNGELFNVTLAEISDKIKPETASVFKDFFRCSGCHRIFWEGSHYERMKNYIEKLTEERRVNINPVSCFPFG
jgi:uncharacterized protein